MARRRRKGSRAANRSGCHAGVWILLRMGPAWPTTAARLKWQWRQCERTGGFCHTDAMPPSRRKRTGHRPPCSTKRKGGSMTLLLLILVIFLLFGGGGYYGYRSGYYGGAHYGGGLGLILLILILFLLFGGIGAYH